MMKLGERIEERRQRTDIVESKEEEEKGDDGVSDCRVSSFSEGRRESGDDR